MVTGGIGGRGSGGRTARSGAGSAQVDAGDAGRLRWRCRRGLLELDLILQRFLERHLGELDPDERGLLLELLEHPDNDLLDWVMGRREPRDARYRTMVQLMRAA